VHFVHEDCQIINRLGNHKDRIRLGGPNQSELPIWTENQLIEPDVVDCLTFLGQQEHLMRCLAAADIVLLVSGEGPRLNGALEATGKRLFGCGLRGQRETEKVGCRGHRRHLFLLRAVSTLMALLAEHQDDRNSGMTATGGELAQKEIALSSVGKLIKGACHSSGGFLWL
jgi:hypothetical protein